MNLCPSSILSLALGVAVVSPAPCTAQIRASEFATVSQTIDGTVVTVKYSRPRVRGRDTIFGGPVFWGEVWTPGANWATTLEFSSDVELNGHAVPEGKYSLWLVVQPESWTVVLDTTARLFHTDRPGESPAQIRFSIQPRPGPFTEALAFTFTDLSPRGVTLAMNWQETYVPFHITVESSRESTVTPAVAAQYVGSYSMRWTEGLASDFQTPVEVGFEISYENGSLLAEFDPPPFDDWASMMLLPLIDDWFTPAALLNGEIFDVISELVLEFEIEDGLAIGFDFRAENDDLLATALKDR